VELEDKTPKHEPLLRLFEGKVPTLALEKKLLSLCHVAVFQPCVKLSLRLFQPLLRDA
jgi:hypothetical protein